MNSFNDTIIQTLKTTIGGKKSSINYLQTGLMYADHGAYSQDLTRIRRLQEEIYFLEKELAAALTSTATEV
jgi:hypothetical protein